MYSQTLVCGNRRTTRHVPSSTHSSTTYQSLRIQLVQNAPDDGPTRSEICRANKKCWIKIYSLRPHCVFCGLHIYITKWYTVPTMSRPLKAFANSGKNVWICTCSYIYIIDNLFYVTQKIIGAFRSRIESNRIHTPTIFILSPSPITNNKSKCEHFLSAK